MTQQRHGPRPASLSIEPLRAIAQPRNTEGRAHARSSIAEIAEAIGVDLNTVHRWARKGIPHHAADRAAIAFGYHPLELWPDFLDDLEVA